MDDWTYRIKSATMMGRLPETYNNLADALDPHEEVPRDVLVGRGVPRHIVDDAVDRSILSKRGHSGKVWVQAQAETKIWTLDRRASP